MWKNSAKLMEMNAREFIGNILDKCPSYATHLPDCPLASLRAEPDIKTQKEKLAALSDDEIDDLVRKHFLCVCRKEGCGT